jgi:hypothetical protein
MLPLAHAVTRHNFMEKLIRAQVDSDADLVKHRSETNVKAAGKIRMEGKTTSSRRRHHYVLPWCRKWKRNEEIIKHNGEWVLAAVGRSDLAFKFG